MPSIPISNPQTFVPTVPLTVGPAFSTLGATGAVPVSGGISRVSESSVMSCSATSVSGTEPRPSGLAGVY